MKKVTTIGSILTLGIFLIAANIGGTAGCGGSGAGGGGGGSGVDVGTGTGRSTADSSTAASSALSVAGEAIGAALGGGSAGLSALKLPVTKNAAVSESVTCETGGPATVTGDVNSDSSGYDFDLDLAFNACEGVDGSLRLSGSGTGDDTGFSMDFNIDGTIGAEGCSLEFVSFGFEMVGSSDGSSMTFTWSGAFTGACGEDTVTCDFGDGVDFTEISESDIESYCTCTGSSC